MKLGLSFSWPMKATATKFDPDTGPVGSRLSSHTHVHAHAHSHAHTHFNMIDVVDPCMMVLC